MREVIDRILDGKFEYERGELSFSVNRIEINLRAGEDYEGSFHLSGKPEYITEGYLYTSDSRMECLTKRFSGTGEEIGFLFHGKGMESGDVLQGSFYVVSNQGEYELPFVVMTAGKTLTTSLGEMKNLFHFTNLAKSSWTEAVRLFYHPNFENIFENSDRKYKSLYRGLSGQYGNERNVEEFLIAIHKKQRVNYIIDEDRLCLADVEDGVSRHEVLLTKNGWGYSHLQVEVNGAFLSVDKETLCDDDFLGNRCHFHYYVNHEKLHKGLNHGSLRFFNPFMETSVPIEVKMADAEYEQGALERKKKRLLVRVMEYYRAFRMKKIATKVWLAKNYELMDEWGELDAADPGPKLYRAHLLLTEGRLHEAGGTLDQARNAILQSKDMDHAVWCYYLYLSTLRGRDENYVNQIAEEVASSYEKDPGNWRIGWLLLYLSPEYNMSYSKKWMFIKRQFERGCISPVFYIEALLLVKAEPSLFMELGAFEMQMLHYAAKHDLLTDEIVMQLHYLIPRKSGDGDGLLKILKKGYERKPDSETLQNICTLLIRGNCRGREDFPFYAAGVEENLRITKLYEYYMYSLDMEELVRLPKVVYMYFAYHNNLDWERSAYLYASLLQYRAQLPDLYEKERFQIQEFALQMIRSGLINRHLAFVYKQVLGGETMSEKTGGELAPLLFSVHVKTMDRRMRKLIVLYAKETTEKSVMLTGGQAVLPLYGEDYVLLLEDSGGNRRVPSGELETERLFTEENILAKARERDFATLSLQICICEEHRAGITAENIRRYERIFESGEVAPAYKRTIIPRMAKFYYDNDRMEELDGFLEKISPALLDAERRGEIMQYLTLRDKPETAVEWIKEYGVNGIAPKILLRLASKMIGRLNRTEDETVLFLCFYAFRKGKADMVTLSYLMEYYEGAAKLLRDIWKSAGERGMDVHSFSERILVQTLYSGGFVGEAADIFSKAVERDADISLEKAFLSRCAYDYFVKDQITEDVIFEEIGRLLRAGEQMLKVCMLAYARYYTENRYKMRRETGKILADCLRRLLEEGVVLPYFPACADICPALYRFGDKTILEHRTKPGRRIFLYYMIEPGEGDYRKIEMKEIYEGVFCSMFVLFFGEKLYYYIAETDGEDIGEKEEITGSGSISCGDMESDTQGSRFRMLNDTVIAEALQDYDTVEQMLMEYEQTDRMQKELFNLCK